MNIKPFFIALFSILILTVKSQKLYGQNLKNILEKAKSGLTKTSAVPLNNQEIGNALK